MTCSSEWLYGPITMVDSTKHRDGFIERAEAELERLLGEDRALAAQEDGVRRKRAELGGRIELLRSSVATYRDLMDIKDETLPSSRLFEEEVPQGTIAEMAAALIERHGGPMKVSDIVQELETRGKLKRGPGGNAARGNYGTVFGTLARHRGFLKTGTGEFGLAPDLPYCRHCGPGVPTKLDADGMPMCRQCGQPVGL